MENFRDVAHLQLALQAVYADQPGVQPGQAYLREFLKAERAFTEEQARLYVSTVVSRNTEASADQMANNARKLIGRWLAATSSGIPGGWFNSSQESWNFSEDLAFEHKLQTFESYITPFGSSYSRPRSSVQQGIWAPSDWEEDNKLDVVVIFLSGDARRLQLVWTDDAIPLLPRSCSIGQQAFSRQY
jgi:hypothetical protein